MTTDLPSLTSWCGILLSRYISLITPKGYVRIMMDGFGCWLGSQILGNFYELGY